MKKIRTIAHWELMGKIKSRSFFIFSVIFPIFFIFLGLSPLFDKTPNESPIVIGISSSEELTEIFIDQIEQRDPFSHQPDFISIKLENLLSPTQIDSIITNTGIDAVITIPTSPKHIHNSALLSSRFVTEQKINKLENGIKNTLILSEAKRHGIQISSISNALENIKLKTNFLDNGETITAENILSRFLQSYFWIMLLTFSIMISGGLFVRSLLEEKSNRIIEILLSSSSERQLLAGKILGLGSLGLFQLAIWTICISLFSSFSGNELNFTEELPLKLFYFLQGYLIYTSVFIGFGALANTNHEAQQISSVLSTLLIIPMLLVANIIEAPNSGLSDILAYCPFTSPATMLALISSSSISVAQVVFTTIINLVTLTGLIVICGKLFKFGILHYGKRLSVKEIIKLVR